MADQSSTTAVWVSGAIVSGQQATVTADDHGLLLGDGVFETLQVRSAAVFARSRHLARLARALGAAGIPAPDAGALDSAIDAVLAAAPNAGRIRITVTSGPGPAGTARGHAGPTVVVSAGAAAAPATRCSSLLLPWVRNERSPLAGIKSTSYGENVVASAYARQRGADDGVFLNTRSELCEGITSNLVVELDGELLTPPLDSGCLPGITRELVLEWSSTTDRPVLERPVPASVLDQVRRGQAGLLALSSLRGVVPVTSLDGVPTRWGPAAAALVRLYSQRSALEIDP